MSDFQIIDVPGHGRVEFPASMSDAEITAAIQKNMEQQPARMSPNVATQGEKYRQNMAPPESVMDPRYDAYKKAQQGSDTMDVLGGIAGMGVGGILKPGAQAMQGAGRWLMRSAIKPSTVEDPAKVSRAIETGLTTPSGGMTGLNMGNVTARGRDLNQQVSGILERSQGAIPLDNLHGYGNDLLGRMRYVNDVEGLPAAAEAKTKFLSGETFNDLGQRERELVQRSLERRASAQGALQDAGRFATTGAQQETAAMNWHPVEGLPRAPYRYSPHAERVPEATGAMTDALVIARQRQREAEFARRELESLPPNEREGMLPLPQAQAMKQNLYAQLGDKAYGFGQKPMADRDMKKALAAGLRRDLEVAEPGVIPLNAEASDLWNLHNVAGRGVSAAQNKNPLGLNLGIAIHSPTAAAAFALDRSQLAKALLARGLYSQVGQRAPGVIGGALAGYNMGPEQ